MRTVGLDLLNSTQVDDTTPTWVINNEMYELMDEVTVRTRQLNYELSQFARKVPDITQPNCTSFMESIKSGFRKIMEAIKRFIRWVKGKLFGIGPKTSRYVRRQKAELSKLKKRIADYDLKELDQLTFVDSFEKVIDNVSYHSITEPGDDFNQAWLDWLNLPSEDSLKDNNCAATLARLIKYLPAITTLINEGIEGQLHPDLVAFLQTVGLRNTVLGNHREVQALTADPNFDIYKQTGSLDAKQLLELEPFNYRCWTSITKDNFSKLVEVNRKLDHLDDCVVLLDNAKAELDDIVSSEKKLERESDHAKALVSDRMILLSNKIQAASLLITNCVMITSMVEQNIIHYLDMADAAILVVRAEMAETSSTNLPVVT